MRVLRDDRVAASHLVYFLLSAALFMPLVGGMLYFMRDVSESQIDSAAGLEARSRDVLEKITGSAGMLDDCLGGTSPEDPRDWELCDGEVVLSEVGISEKGNHRLLSLPKVENLQQAGVEANADAYVDYDEMHAALRLDERFDFHLRMEPIRTDLRVDPFGSRPLKGSHVAYIGAVTSNSFSSGEWQALTPQAQKEIDALKALGLGASDGSQGFDEKGYHPCHNGQVWDGTVIADTSTSITGPPSAGSCALGAETKRYTQWFAQDYLFQSSGVPRFDAVFFGTNVDITKWRDDGAQEFRDFVEAGGTLIFLQPATQITEFVTRCSSDPCLFNKTGTRLFASADPSHQLLFAPNAIPTTFTGLGGWAVCNENDPDSLNDERLGFFPVIADWTDPCFSVSLGTTTSERYGDGGGTVILASLDLVAAQPDDVSALFANMLSYGILSSAYLVYGEELPDDKPIRVAQRVMALELGNGSHTSVTMKLYLWRHW